MGKRIATERQQHETPIHLSNANRHPTARSIRKRKRAAVKDGNAGSASKYRRLNNGNGFDWHENDDEDSSSSGTGHDVMPPALLQTPQAHNSCAALLLNASLGGGFSEHNNSNSTQSPRPVYTLRPSVVNGTILRDVLSKAWRLGRPIGKGNFGEIFLASDDTICPVSTEAAKYVVKIEPHSNGPLFVEVHCLINTTRSKELINGSVQQPTSDIEPLPPHISQSPPSGIPSYIASGTHYFGDARYRFLVLPRFDRDLHSLIKNSRVQQKCLLVLAINIINVLEHLHDKGYCHNDIKAQNLMISKCKYLKKRAMAHSNGKKNYEDHYEEKQQTTDSGNSSEQETNDCEYFIKDEKFGIKLLPNDDDDEDEDFDDGATTNSNNSNSNSNSLDLFQTPVNKNCKRNGRNNIVEYSGSNPVRSCRRDKPNFMYEEMVKSHYLRPAKRISYAEFFNEDGFSPKPDANIDQLSSSSDNESDEFVPPSSARRSAASCSAQKKSSHTPKRSIRRQAQPKNVLHGTRSSKRNGAAFTNAIAAAVEPTRYQYAHVEEEHIFLIDFGLASKYQDKGVHRPFIMDQRRAHDGTLEFTSRDAHLGAHSRRSDLECLGYNLLYWSEGYLPWKDVAQQQQQEKVHRAKELFMTDVREMSRQFYGRQVPKYLGEFLQQIGQLAYQERPNYERYRNIFKREYQRLGYDIHDMRLSSEEILRTCICMKDELDGAGVKCDIFELNNKVASNTMRNAALTTPFQEHSFTNRVSPKNLRSKSNKKNSKKKKFSWAEVLSQDPDQIARERAVKEFEREEVICPLQSRLPRRYEGKPTYAIIAVEQLRRDKGLTVQEHNEEDEQLSTDEDDDEEDGEDDHVVQSDDDGTQENNEEETENAYECDYKLIQVRGRGRPRKNPQQSSSPQRALNGNKVNTRTGAKTSTKYGTKSRNSSSLAAKPLTLAVGSNKRGCATRKDLAALASATGEVEEDKQRHVHIRDQPSRQRRTRRCLYETEAVLGTKQLVENNNSNFAVASAQSMHIGIWSSKYDDENVYGGKGRHVNSSSRHCRK